MPSVPHFLSNTPDEGIGNIVGVGVIVGTAVGVGTDGVLVEGNNWGAAWTVIVGVAAGAFAPQATEPTMLTASNNKINGLMLVTHMNRAVIVPRTLHPGRSVGNKKAA